MLDYYCQKIFKRLFLEGVGGHEVEDVSCESQQRRLALSGCLVQSPIVWRGVYESCLESRLLKQLQLDIWTFEIPSIVLTQVQVVLNLGYGTSTKIGSRYKRTFGTGCSCDQECQDQVFVCPLSRKLMTLNGLPENAMIMFLVDCGSRVIRVVIYGRRSSLLGICLATSSFTGQPSYSRILLYAQGENGCKDILSRSVSCVYVSIWRFQVNLQLQIDSFWPQVFPVPAIPRHLKF